MDYSVKQLSKEEFLVLLEAFSDSYLLIPIVKAPKRFESKVKGFRLKKLPKNILHMLYYNEIHGDKNSVLEEHLITNLTECLDYAGISDLVEGFKGTVFELSTQLELLISKSNLNISPHTVLMVSKYDCSQEDINTIKVYHNYLVTITTQQKVAYEASFTELKNHFQEETKDQGQKFSQRYKEIEKKLIECQNNLHDYECEREHSAIEVTRLNNTITETKRLVDTLRSQLRDYDALSKKATDQRAEISSLNEQIEKLNVVIQNLETKVLSPDDILDICREVLDDLTATGIDEQELKKIAHETFTNDMSIVDAWTLLEEFDKKAIEEVFSEMKRGSVSDSHIRDLDNIENNVYIRYMIVKSLKVIFFRFLEQNTQKSSIREHFQSEEQ